MYKEQLLTLREPSFNISKSDYTFTIGQENTFYDYGTIKRKADTDAPKKKIKIYFESAYYASTDSGDITNCKSYR